MKVCRHCGYQKAESEFYTGRAKCKECVSSRRKCWYLNNREREIKKVKNWISINRDKHRMYVKRCDDRRRSEKHIYSQQRITFLDKRIQVDVNPRIGKCSRCGKEGLTNMHHERYDESNPLKFTVELCVPCHMRHHKGRIKAY